MGSGVFFHRSLRFWFGVAVLYTGIIAVGVVAVRDGFVVWILHRTGYRWISVLDSSTTVRRYSMGNPRYTQVGLLLVGGLHHVRDEDLGVSTVHGHQEVIVLHLVEGIRCVTKTVVDVLLLIRWDDELLLEDPAVLCSREGKHKSG
jgi:hypothetical protein